MAIPIQNAVERLIDARLNHRQVAPLSETYGDFTLLEAYAIQDGLLSEFVKRGEAPTGWKLAATAPVGQAIIGVTEPGSGFLSSRIYRWRGHIGGGLHRYARRGRSGFSDGRAARRARGDS